MVYCYCYKLIVYFFLKLYMSQEGRGAVGIGHCCSLPAVAAQHPDRNMRLYRGVPGHAWYSSRETELHVRVSNGKVRVGLCRAFLAKGLLLKGNGRAGDAQRMFLQARFLAPAGARAVVDQVIKG